MKKVVALLLWIGLCVGTSVVAAEAIDVIKYPRAAAAVAAQRVAMDAFDQVEAPRLLVAALAGSRAELIFAHAQAHLLFAYDAIGPAAAAWRRVDDLASRTGYRRTRMSALRHRAETSLRLGGYGASKRFAQTLLVLGEHADGGSSAATALGYLGIVARRQGDLDAALQLHTSALERLRAGNDEVDLALTLTNLGTVLRDRGEFAEALELQLQAMQIRERTGDELETSYRNVALLYREIEDEKTARAYFVRALEAAAHRVDPETYAPVLGSFASLLNDVGDYAPALAAAEEALLIDTALGNRANEGFERIEAGRALLGPGRAAEGRPYLESALTIAREIGQSEIIAKALLHLAGNAQRERDNLRVRGLIDEAIVRLETTRFLPQLAQADAVRERIAVAQHDPATALRYARLPAKQREMLLGSNASRRLSALDSRHARAEASQQLTLLQKDNELQAAHLHARDLRERLSTGAIGSLMLALCLAIWGVARMRRLNHALTGKTDRIIAQQNALASANAALTERADALYIAAISDPLTGVFNRTHVREQIGLRLAESIGNDSELAVLMIDFDHFKQVNDALGHFVRRPCTGCRRSGDARVPGSRRPSRALRWRGIRDRVARPRRRVGAGSRPARPRTRPAGLARVAVAAVRNDGQHWTCHAIAVARRHCRCTARCR
ncbi:MAG: tetratricopeptide repeat protein [Dokdonella sp.]